MSLTEASGGMDTGRTGVIINLKMVVPGSEAVVKQRDVAAGYAGRQRKGVGTRTVYPYESYSDIRDVLDGLLERGEYRNYGFMMMGLATGLRVSDLVRLRVRDVYDVGSGTFREVLDIHEHKTGKRTVSEVDEVLLTEAAVHGLTMNFEHDRRWRLLPDDPVFMSARRSGDGSYHLTENMGWRIVKGATERAGVEINAGSHTLRKTFLNIANAVGSASRLSGGSGLVLSDVMVLARHSRLTTTLRYTTLMKSRLLSLRRGVSSFLMGRTRVKSLKMEYEWEDGSV